MGARKGGMVQQCNPDEIDPECTQGRVTDWHAIYIYTNNCISHQLHGCRYTYPASQAWSIMYTVICYNTLFAVWGCSYIGCPDMQLKSWPAADIGSYGMGRAHLCVSVSLPNNILLYWTISWLLFMCVFVPIVTMCVCVYPFTGLPEKVEFDDDDDDDAVQTYAGMYACVWITREYV